MATQYRRCFSTTNSNQLHGGAPPKFLTSNTHGEQGWCVQHATAPWNTEGWRVEGWRDGGWRNEGWMGTRGLTEWSLPAGCDTGNTCKQRGKIKEVHSDWYVLLAWKWNNKKCLQEIQKMSFKMCRKLNVIAVHLWRCIIFVSIF